MDVLDVEAVGSRVVLQDQLLQVEECALVLHVLPHLLSRQELSAGVGSHSVLIAVGTQHRAGVACLLL